MIQYIPKDPAPLMDTSNKLIPYHLPPFRTKEEYIAWKAKRKK
jgi:hypothetical protein